MKDDKVSQFTPRRRPVAEAVKSVIADAGSRPPIEDQGSPLGTDLGDFDRDPCGTCWHWKRQPQAGLNQGVCMLAPPQAYPIQKGGAFGQMLVRPMLEAEHEGCDQWDDEPDFDGDGVPASGDEGEGTQSNDAQRIAAAG